MLDAACIFTQQNGNKKDMSILHNVPAEDVGIIITIPIGVISGMDMITRFDNRVFPSIVGRRGEC